jgi:hypothetical protein
VPDLESRTNQDSERTLTRHRITNLLTDATVRSIVRREGESANPVFAFTHTTLKDTFTAEMGESAQTDRRDAITRSAQHWAAADWPDETPQWITNQYTAYLEGTGETAAWGRLLDSARWAALLLRRTGADLRLRLDSERHLRALSREHRPSLKTIVNRGDRLESLRRPALGLPASMAVAWADAGFPERAERIAREQPPSRRRSWLFRRLGMAAHEHAQHHDALRLLDFAVEDAVRHAADAVRHGADDTRHPADDVRLLHSALAELARTVGGDGLRWAVLKQLRTTDEDIRAVELNNLPNGTTAPSVYADLLFRPGRQPRYRLWSYAREAADQGDLHALPGMIYALDMEGALGVGNFEGDAQRDALAEIAATAAGRHPQHPFLVAVLEAAEDRCIEALKAHRAGAWCESEDAISGLADVVTVLIRRGQWDSNSFMLAETGAQAVVERAAAGARLSACALGAARAHQPELALQLLRQAGQGVSTVIARIELVRHWAREPDIWPQAIEVMNTMNYGRYEEAETVAACLRTGLDCGMEDEALELLVSYIEQRSTDAGSRVDMYATRVTTFVITAVRGCVRIDRDRSARLLAGSLRQVHARASAWAAYADECARRRLVPSAMDGMDRAQHLCEKKEMTRKQKIPVLRRLLWTSLRINDEARAEGLLEAIEDLARAGRHVSLDLLALLVRVHRKRAAGSRAEELLREIETVSAHGQAPQRQAHAYLLAARLRADTEDLRAATELATDASNPVWAWATSHQPEMYKLLRVTAARDRQLAGALYGRFTEQVADQSQTFMWPGQHSKWHGDLLDLAAELGLWDEGVDFIERLPTDTRAQCLGKLATSALDRAPDRIPILLAKGFGYGVAPSLLAAAGRADISVTGTCFVAFIQRMEQARRH